MASMDSTDVQAEIDAAVDPFVAEHVASDPDKVAQLRSHVATVKMVVGQIAERAANRVAEKDE